MSTQERVKNYPIIEGHPGRRMIIDFGWPHYPDRRYCVRAMEELVGANSETLLAHLCGTDVLCFTDRGNTHNIVGKKLRLPLLGENIYPKFPDHAYFFQYYQSDRIVFSLFTRSYRSRKTLPLLHFCVSSGESTAVAALKDISKIPVQAYLEHKRAEREDDPNNPFNVNPEFVIRRIKEDAFALFRRGIMCGYAIHELLARGEEASIHMELKEVLRKIKREHGYRYLVYYNIEPNPEQFLNFYAVLQFAEQELVSS